MQDSLSAPRSRHFEPIQRHSLASGSGTETFVSELSDLQRQILKLLDIPAESYTSG